MLILCPSIVCVPQVAVCLRDGFAWSIMWATCSRGRDCGRLRLSDFVLADGRTLFTAWAALRQKPLPTLYLAQQGTKTHRGARAPLRELEPRGGGLCPVNNLGLLLEAYARCGQAVTDHLVRPLAKPLRAWGVRRRATASGVAGCSMSGARVRPPRRCCPWAR